MLAKVDEVVEAITLAVPAVVAAVLARRWWKRRPRASAPQLPPAANDDPAQRPALHGLASNDVEVAAAASLVEPQWPESFHLAEARRRLNRNMAEAAHLSRRGRAPIVEITNRQRMAEIVRVLRGTDDAAAWVILEPITVSGEVIALIESVRHNSGEFSAQSLRLCVERLWGLRVARESGMPAEALPVRRGDPAAGGPPST